MEPVEPRMASRFKARSFASILIIADSSNRTETGCAACYRITCAYHSTGAASSSASIRSRTPPWPGKRLPESFTPAERFSADSAKSPTCAATFTTTAITSHHHQTSSANDSFTKFHCARNVASQNRPPVTTTLPTTEPTEPTHVLFGLSVGASLRLP